MSTKARFRGGSHAFDVGDKVYVRPSRWLVNMNQQEQLHYHDTTFEVMEQTRNGYGWPHYVLEDILGNKWLISQLELSSIPFTNFR